MIKTTETSSLYHDLENKSVLEILTDINAEDQRVAIAVKNELPFINRFIEQAEKRLIDGGRLFYIGAGTSGRLGILDASEIPPTYGMPQGRVIGLIAGGDKAIRIAVENAEDDPQQAWIDLQQHNINDNDVLVGIAASGTTPYVIGGVTDARKHGVLTGCIVCNQGSPLAQAVEYPIEVVVGPEYVTGSTRMKSGTAQKLVLNMISTTLMIRLGRVEGNKMVDMQLSNEKLVERGTKMIMEQTQVDHDQAKQLLLTHGSVRKAVAAYKSSHK